MKRDQRRAVSLGARATTKKQGEGGGWLHLRGATDDTLEGARATRRPRGDEGDRNARDAWTSSGGLDAAADAPPRVTLARASPREGIARWVSRALRRFADGAPERGGRGSRDARRARRRWGGGTHHLDRLFKD